MGMFSSKPMLDPENVGHILLGTSAFLSSCYVIIYRKFIFGENIGWLTRFWLGYTMTQSIKCVMTVESTMENGYTFGYTEWPDVTRFINMLLTFVVSLWNLCTWTTIIFNSGSDYNSVPTRKWYRIALKIILALFVVDCLACIILYIACGNFAFAADAYVTPISVLYMIAFWIPSWIAVVMAIRGAFKGSLVPIESEKYDNNVTKKFLIVTLCGVVIGILVGAWSGFDVYEGKIGKAFLGLFYVIPTTAMVHYLERFENFKGLLCSEQSNVEEMTADAPSEERQSFFC